MIKRLAIAIFAGVLAMSLFACGTPYVPKGTLPQLAGNAATSGATLLQAANVHGNLSVSLPSDINVGERLAVLVGANSYSGGTMTFVTPSGWTADAAMASVAFFAIERTADGTEGAALLIDGVSTGPTGIDYNAIAFRVRGADPASTIALAAAGNGATKTPDPPSLTSGFGAVSQLYVAIEQDIVLSTATTARVAPAGYDRMMQVDSSLGQHLGLSAAFKNSVLATEDPGTFTLTNTNTPSVSRTRTLSIKGVP